MIKQAYRYGGYLAAREAGYASFQDFVKKAMINPVNDFQSNMIRNTLAGMGGGAVLGAGTGALLADEGRR
jgi:hypothetical protein